MMKFLGGFSLLTVSLIGMWIGVYGSDDLPGVARAIIFILAWCIFVSLLGFFDSAKPSP